MKTLSILFHDSEDAVTDYCIKKNKWDEPSIPGNAITKLGTLMQYWMPGSALNHGRRIQTSPFHNSQWTHWPVLQHANTERKKKLFGICGPSGAKLLVAQMVRARKERKRRRREDRLQRQQERSVTPLISAHTKAAYYLILHTTYRKEASKNCGLRGLE